MIGTSAAIADYLFLSSVALQPGDEDYAISIVLPTRNLVLFPEMVFPLAIGRPATVAAAQQAVREQRQIGITCCSVIQSRPIPDPTISIASAPSPTSCAT